MPHTAEAKFPRSTANKRRIYDLACGSGGLFGRLWSPTAAKIGDISIYGQESNATMNRAICGIEADFGPKYADIFRRDLRADYVLANPFNDSDTDLRGSAFFQSEASPQVVREAKDNMAGFVLANGSMSSNQSGDCLAQRNENAEGQTAESAKATRHPPGPHRGQPRGLHGRRPAAALLQLIHLNSVCHHV